MSMPRPVPGGCPSTCRPSERIWFRSLPTAFTGPKAWVCSTVSAEFVEGQGLLLMIDTRGIAVAAGTSCVSKALKVSPVLSAIGLDHALGQVAILLTLGQDNTDADLDYALATIPQVVATLRDM